MNVKKYAALTVSAETLRSTPLYYLLNDRFLIVDQSKKGKKTILTTIGKIIYLIYLYMCSVNITLIYACNVHLISVNMFMVYLLMLPRSLILVQ